MRSRAITGLMKERTIHITAVVVIVAIDAFLVIATHPTDSPYVVLAQPPKKAPTIEPIPSPSKVLCKPGSLVRSLPMIDEIFLWSARNNTRQEGYS